MNKIYNCPNDHSTLCILTLRAEAMIPNSKLTLTREMIQNAQCIFNQLIEELGEMPSYSIDSNETKNTSLKKLRHIVWKTFICK